MSNNKDKKLWLVTARIVAVTCRDGRKLADPVFVVGTEEPTAFRNLPSGIDRTRLDTDPDLRVEQVAFEDGKKYFGKPVKKNKLHPTTIAARAKLKANRDKSLAKASQMQHLAAPAAERLRETALTESFTGK